LDNPEHRRWSIFTLESPAGFGLFQRERSYATYADLEAHYHQRPNLWIEPREPWGQGSVRLLELPTPDEYHDNIAAFWTPDAPFRAGEKRVFGYRMTWSQEEPRSRDLGLARVERTLIGLAEEPSAARWPSRRIVLDFSDRLPTLEGQPLDAQISCHGARCSAPIVTPNSETGGWRISFEAVPTTDDAVELTASLTSFGSLASEVWHGRLDGL
jgi:glucans biosynthesis protein